MKSIGFVETFNSLDKSFHETLENVEANVELFYFLSFLRE